MANKSYRANPCTQKITPAPEHTPIYDLDAYHSRQSQQQKQRIINNFKDASIFLSMTVLTVSIFFWGI